MRTSLPVSRYKAGNLGQCGTRIKKLRKERAAPGPCARRIANTELAPPARWAYPADI